VCGDGFVGVDSLVTHGDADIAVPGDDLGDVRRQSVEDGVGDEHAPEVMRSEVQRGSGGGVGQTGMSEGLGEQVSDETTSERAMFGSGSPLEQQRRWRKPHPLVAVVGAHERDCSVRTADAADDRAEHVGEFRADYEQSFGIGLGWGDLQLWHQLTGAGQPVLDQAVMAQLKQLFDPDSGMAEHLDDRPRPKGVLLIAVE